MCGGGGGPPPTVRAFCILMLLMVQFGAYARYFPRIDNLTLEMVKRRQLHMHTRNFSFLFFRLLNLRGATAPIAPLATPLGESHTIVLCGAAPGWHNQSIAEPFKSFGFSLSATCVIDVPCITPMHAEFHQGTCFTIIVSRP